jgi:hypothetical protein
MNPQNLNRYSYCLNNPLKYTDPSGHMPSGLLNDVLWAYNSGFISQQEVSYLILLLNCATPAGMYVAMHEIAAVNAAHTLCVQKNIVVLEDFTQYFDDDYDNTTYEIDIVANEQYFYEVKPIDRSARKQVNEYSQVFKPGNPIAGLPNNIPIVGNITMSLTSPGPGIVKYSFTGKNNENLKPKEVLDDLLNVRRIQLVFTLLFSGIPNFVPLGDLVPVPLVPATQPWAYLGL